MAILTFLKAVTTNLLHKPYTRLYPVEKRAVFERTRGHIQLDIESCSFCGLCDKKCPTKAITVTRGEKTWAIDRLRCIQCNSCTEACPKHCLTMHGAYTSPTRKGVREEYNHA